MLKLIISRPEAKNLGLKKYFTAIPCREGHVAERSVGSAACCACNSRLQKAYAERHKSSPEWVERRKASKKKWEDAHKDRHRDRVLSEKARERGRHYSRQRYWGMTIEERKAYDEYQRKYREAHKEEASYKAKLRYHLMDSEERYDLIQRSRRWQRDNADRVAELRLRYKGRYLKSSEERRAIYRSKLAYHIAYRKKYYQENKGRVLHWTRLRHLRIKLATPKWVDLKAIETVYVESARLSEEKGILFHVDHEIPLQGRFVSGLHVETNLRIVPAYENLSKGNRFDPSSPGVECLNDLIVTPT